MEIRRTETNSVNSINLDNNINAEIIHTSRPMPFDSTTTTINSYEVFMNEADSCDKYRLLLKINPFCTNILFNSCTEIVKNEGGGNNDGIETVLDNSISAYTPDCPNAYGKYSNISRVDMISNTEYSREEIGYTYHPGYDIFDNHILRNRSYNIVNYILSGDRERNHFNTISDYSRYNDGSPVFITPRRFTASNSNPFTADVRIKKHLYKVDDLYSFFELDSVNENLREENGWYGFKNTTVIESVVPQLVDVNERPMDVNRVINSRGNCDFIDMYPDRTLFSFNPKYNPYRRREENNWDVILTYPYRNTYNHNIVSNYRDENGEIVDPEYRVNGLLVASCQNVMDGNGSNVTLFRTFSKHGLNSRDSVMFSYLDPENNNSSDSVYQTLPNTYWVTRVGDINNNNKENFFYLSDYNFLNDLFSGRILETFYHPLGSVYTEDVDYEHTYGSEPNTIPSDNGGVILIYSYEVGGGGGVELSEVPTNADENSVENITVDGVNYILTSTYYEVGDGENPPSVILSNILSRMKFRVSRVYKGKKSDYYIRIFRKLPNWKYSREQLTEYVSENRNLMYEFTLRNACNEDGHNILFNHSVTPMAFSNTIYNDAVTQYLFTDSIQAEHIKDNRGRPLSSFYITVLKSNRGYREWYGLGTSRNIGSDNVEYSHCFGKLLSGFNYLALSRDSRLWPERNYLSDIGILTDKNIMDESLYGIPTSANEWVGLPDDIGISNDEFVGDICEWNDYECIERVLEKVCYRFNTVQREYGSELLDDFNFTDHELTSDDYDMGGNGQNWGGFNVTTYDRYSPNFQNMLTKPEGYFYNPHYEVVIKKFSNTISQGSHELLSIKKATPTQADGIFIRLETYGKHKLTSEDSVYLCDDVSHLWYLNDVVYIDSPNSFVINIIPRDIEQVEEKPYVDWITTCENINGGLWKVRVRNKSIPRYASNISVNTFLWRDILSSVGSDSLGYPFANGYNYIEQTINFFLKRQDPYGYNGLYYVQAPADSDREYLANSMFPDVEGTKPILETISYDNYIIPDGLC